MHHLKKYRKSDFKMILKKLIPAGISALMLFSSSANAQVTLEQLKAMTHHYIEYGVIAGANLQTISAQPFNNAYNTGAVVGGYALRRWDEMGVKVGLSISTTQFETKLAATYPYQSSYGYNPKDVTTKATFNLAYVNIPVVYIVKPSERFNFEIGAQFSYLAYSGESTTIFKDTWKTDDLFKKTNISLVVGAEHNITKKLGIGAKYNFGISDINGGNYKGVNDAWYTGSGQVYLRYELNRNYKY